MATMLGGDRVARMLAAEGVDTVFGIIDGSYFGLYSRLGAHGIRLITPRHETTAVHMAGAYARLTGRLGVCIASNGPGRRQRAAGRRGRAGRGQPGAAAHELAALADRRPRPRRHLPVLRPGRGHAADDEVERRGHEHRACPRDAAPGVADLVAGPSRCGAPVHPRRRAQHRVRRARAARPAARRATGATPSSRRAPTRCARPPTCSSARRCR